MILNVISEYISIDELQKIDEKKYVHFISRPVVDFLDLYNWDSVIYTTKSIARAVIMRHPGSLHLFRIIECNQPFDIKVDGKSCRVTMFDNSGLAENLAIYFKGDNCTALYTGSFTRCRALLLDKLLHHYVLKGIDVLYVDNTAVRSLDPVSACSASAEILQIAKKYPDHQIVMSVPPFGYEDLIFSLASAAKMKVFVEGAHLFAFEKHLISDIFEKDSQKAKVIVQEEEEEEVTLESIVKRFAEKKIITLRILLCELPPKNYYENIGLFEVNWSPHPSLSEIYTLINYINPKRVMEIDSMPKLPSFLIVKKENQDTDNSVAVNLQIRDGRSTPVSEIEELSAAESYNNTHNYRQKGRKEINIQCQFDSFVQNNIASLHTSAWKYHTLPKRKPRRAKRDHQKNTTVELNRSKESDFSNYVPSVSTFSSLNFSANSRKDEHADISRSRKSRENESTGNAHLGKTLIGSDSQDLSHAFSSVSDFSSLFSSVENDLNLTGQVSALNASKISTAQSRQIGDISDKDCANPINNTRKTDAKGNHAKAVAASESAESQLSYELPSISTFSSLATSSERNIMWNSLVNEAVSRINKIHSQANQKSPENDKSKQTEKETLQNEGNSGKNTSKEAHQGKSHSAVNSDENNSSYEMLSISTFSSLSSSVESDFNFRQINKLVSQRINTSKTGIQSSQNGDKTGVDNTEPIRNTPKKGNQANGLNMNATKGNRRSSYKFPSIPIAAERSSMWNDLINEVVSQMDISFSQSTEKSLDNVQSNQGEKVLNNEDKSIQNASEENEEGPQNKPVVCSNEFQQSHQSSVSTFSSLPSPDCSNFQLNDETNRVKSRKNIKAKSITVTNRAQNRSKRRRQNADNTRSNQCEQKGWKSSCKSPKKGKIVRQAKAGNPVNRLKGDDISGSTFSSVNQVNEIMSQLHIQKPHKIFGTSTGTNQELPQRRRLSAETVQNKRSLKKRVTKIKDTSKKSARDLEEDAQVVPNVSDGNDSEITEEFKSYNISFADDTLSVSTFTSLSLSSLSDEIPPPVRKMSKKKKQRRRISKAKRLEKERTSGIVTASYDGQSRETEQKESTKSGSKQCALEKKELVPHTTMKMNAVGESGGQQEEAAFDNDGSHSPKSPCMSLLSFTSSERDRFSNLNFKKKKRRRKRRKTITIKRNRSETSCSNSKIIDFAI